MYACAHTRTCAHTHTCAPVHMRTPTDRRAPALGRSHLLQAKYLADILHSGLDSRLSSPDGMFGQGAYFAEAASKADQYSRVADTASGHAAAYRDEDRAVCYLIVAKVCMGEPFTAIKPLNGRRKPPCCEASADGKCAKSGNEHCGMHEAYDSVLAESQLTDPRACLRWYREFVVYDRNQTLPLYLISYARASDAAWHTVACPVCALPQKRPPEPHIAPCDGPKGCETLLTSWKCAKCGRACAQQGGEGGTCASCGKLSVVVHCPCCQDLKLLAHHGLHVCAQSKAEFLTWACGTCGRQCSALPADPRCSRCLPTVIACPRCEQPTPCAPGATVCASDGCGAEFKVWVCAHCGVHRTKMHDEPAQCSGCGKLTLLAPCPSCGCERNHEAEGSHVCHVCSVQYSVWWCAHCGEAGTEVGDVSAAAM